MAQANLVGWQAARIEIALGDGFVDDGERRLPHRRMGFAAQETPRRGRGAPDHIGEHELQQTKVFRPATNIQHVGDRKTEHAITRARRPLVNAHEHVDPFLRFLAGERDQQVFLGNKMLVKRADRVIAFFGHAAHLQIEQAVLLDQLARGVKEALFALRDFPLPPLRVPIESRA